MAQLQNNFCLKIKNCNKHIVNVKYIYNIRFLFINKNLKPKKSFY